jgi:hypothetical protein
MTFAKLYDGAKRHNMKVVLQRPQAPRNPSAKHMPTDPFRLVVRKQGADVAIAEGQGIDALARVIGQALMVRGFRL